MVFKSPVQSLLMEPQILQAVENSQTGNSFKRAVAVKVRIADLSKGAWKEKFLELPNGENISRARVMATIVGKFISEDKAFGNLTLDDSTDTIRAKTWDNIKIVADSEIGNIVDVIGKVRIYNGEVYLVPEIIRKIDDPNMEVLRQLELVKKYGVSVFKKSEDKSPVEAIDVKKQILTMFSESSDGLSYSEILEKIKAPKTEIEKIIDDLLLGGLCYESSPGIIKRV